MIMKQAELNNILELHQKWLDDDDGLEGKRLSLGDADLSNANLQDANLYCADLCGANLYEANLYNTNLHNANLYCTDLRGTNLHGADLCGADLRGADLRGAKLGWVNWHEAKGIAVYIAGLQSSRHNAQLVYIPSLDVATTGCWQGSWKDTKEQVDKVYKNENISIYKKYQIAFKYIEEQMEADK